MARNPVRKSVWGGKTAEPVRFTIETPYVGQSRGGNYHLFKVQDKQDDPDLIMTIYLRGDRVEGVADPTVGLKIDGFLEEK